MNIYEALRKDHDEQRSLLSMILETEGDSHDRAELFRQLKSALSAHAIAEERHFYIPLLGQDLTQEKSRHGIAEHHQIDELVERLVEAEPSTSAWLTIARQLDEKVRHHLEEEERIVFPLSGKVLSDQQKEQLVADYQDSMRRYTSDS
ncbi:MAG: hemerythrin domain-containing protein [Burkholderiaceae bacterium]